MLSCSVCVKFVWTLHQGNTLVFALTIRRLWKPLRLPTQRPHWYIQQCQKVLTFPPDILWDCFRSSDILGYMEMKLRMSLQERELFTSLLDWNQPWGVSRQNIRKMIKRWVDNQHTTMWLGLISTQWQAGKLISVSSPLLTPGYCPFTGQAPILLPTASLNITPWENIFT